MRVVFLEGFYPPQVQARGHTGFITKEDKEGLNTGRHCSKSTGKTKLKRGTRPPKPKKKKKVYKADKWPKIQWGGP